MPERFAHRVSHHPQDAGTRRGQVSHPNEWVWWLLHPRLPLAPDVALRCLITVEVTGSRIPLGWLDETSGWGDGEVSWTIPENREAHALGPFDSPYAAVAAIAGLDLGNTPPGVSIVAQGVNNTGRHLSEREPLYAGDAAFRAHEQVWTCWDVAQLVMLQAGLWLHWAPSARVCELSAEWMVYDPPKLITIARRKPEPPCLHEEKWRSLR